MSEAIVDIKKKQSNYNKYIVCVMLTNHIEQKMSTVEYGTSI